MLHPSIKPLLVLLLSAITSLGISADAPVKHRLMFFEYGSSPNRFVELDAPEVRCITAAEHEAAAFF